MHMADALISPAVGTTMWAATAGMLAWSSRRISRSRDDRQAPLMGVMGAFVFAAQMINFTIPATGSSGHLGGGLLLTALLGPHAALLTIASVLMVQALFFADGGLLALGCNIINMGFFPAFLAYPLIYRPLAGNGRSKARLITAAIVAAVAGLQMGAFGVVLETTLSRITELPFTTFFMLMLPIHLPIGIVEGLVTASVLAFILKAQPDILQEYQPTAPAGGFLSFKGLVATLAAVALLTGGVVAWYASQQPDGLEWAIKQATGKEELQSPQQGVHARLNSLQQRLALFPAYAFRQDAVKAPEAPPIKQPAPDAGNKAARQETSLAGIIGGAVTLALIFACGLLLRRRRASA